MNSINCDLIVNGIHFYVDNIRSCSSNAVGPILIDDYRGQDIDFNELLNKRIKYQQRLLKGDIPEGCKCCFELDRFRKLKEVDNSVLIKRIYISHWLHCNSSCIYCVRGHETKGAHSDWVKRSKYYDLFPIMKKMIDSGMIDKNAQVMFTGGEPTVLKEFGKLMDLLLDYVDSEISVLTSGIRFDKSIERAYKLGKASLVISIDAGTRETYKKIKRVDKFEQVKKNIKKYLAASEHAKDSFTLKYILVKDYNDNIDEIESWLKLAKDMGVVNIRLDVDYANELFYSNAPVPLKYYGIYEHVKKRAEELKFNLCSVGRVDKILELGHVI